MEYHNKKALELILQDSQIKPYLEENNLVQAFKILTNNSILNGYKYPNEHIGDFINLLLSMKSKYIPNCWVIVKYTQAPRYSSWYFVKNNDSGKGSYNIFNTKIYNTKEEAQAALDNNIRKEITRFNNNHNFPPSTIEILGLIR